MSDVLPITGIPRRGLPPLALVTGDPHRVPIIADMLDGGSPVAMSREYVTYTGSWKGTELTIASHGVGAPGAVLLFQELATAGCTTVIRVGTCGALAGEIADGDLVIAETAIREDGVTDQMVPDAYPASCTPEVVKALQAAAESAGARWHLGRVLTTALFFPGLLPPTLKRHASAGVIAVEMELSALLVTATLKDMRAGGIFAVDGNPARQTTDDYDPHRAVVRDGVRAAIEIALDALATLGDA